jgi:hypothetical protein
MMGLPGFKPGSIEPKSFNYSSKEGINWLGFEKNG